MKSQLRQAVERVHGDTLEADFAEAIKLLEESRIILKSAEKDVAEVLGDMDN